MMHLSVVFIAVLAGLLLPIRLLPTLALVAFLVYPVGYLDVGWLLTLLNPSAVILILWTLRGSWGSIGRRRSRLVVIPLLVLVAICCVSWVQSTAPSRSLEWMVGFILLVVFPVLSRATVGLGLVIRAWMWLAGAWGLIALVEARVFGGNPLYGEIYARSVDNPLIQHWSVYRATTSLGHPLLNAAFLAIGVAIALSLLVRGEKSLGIWVCLAGASVGVVATGSRSGILAVVVAFVFVLLVGLARRETFSRATGIGVLLVGLALAVVLAFGDIVFARSDSWEASDSTSGRQLLFDGGVSAAIERWILGWGPNATSVPARQIFGRSSGNFENSWLETAISLGVLGLAAFAAVLLLSIASALANGRLGVAAALVVYVTCASSFNLLYGYPQALVLLSLLLCAAGASSGAERSATALVLPELDRNVSLSVRKIR